ncbi:dual specificity protein phosphatase 4 isoform 2-T2 [Trichechus inunguis]
MCVGRFVGLRLSGQGGEGVPRVTRGCRDPRALLCACWSARVCKIFVCFCACVRASEVLRNRAFPPVTCPHPSWRFRPYLHPLTVLASLVKRLLCAAHLRVQGSARGYEQFSSEYPEFCAKTKALAAIPPPVPPSTAESLDLGCSSCGTPLHDQGGPVEILPFLYLGSAYHAARRDMLDALGITALLNVSSDCPNHFEGHYQYKCIPVEDNHKADISSWFMEAIEYIDAVKDCRGRVLVHCQAGISRSATICLAYLMMKKRVRLEEAFEFVKQRRSIISPNFSFMGQLLQFESQVLATSCAVEAASPSGPLRERGKATPTPTSQFVFSFPVSVGVHSAPSSLPYLHSPITTSPSC